MGARGNSGRDHQPDPARAWPRGSRASSGSTASTSRTRWPSGTKTAYGAVGEAGRGHDPHGHPRSRRPPPSRRPSTTTRWRSVLAATVEGGREVGRQDAVAAADPARGRRRRLRRPGAVPAVRGRPAQRPWPAGARGVGVGRGRAAWRGAGRRRAGVPVGRRRARGGCLRLRDGLHPDRRDGRHARLTRSIQAKLEELGNSVLVGGDERMVKVHVHNERPDEVIAYGLSLGTLTRITVENLDTMADDVREARATEFVAQDGVSSTGEPAPAARSASKPAAVAVAARPTLGVATEPAAATSPGPAGNGSHGPDAPGTDGSGSSGVEIDHTLGPAIVAVVAGDGLEKRLPRERRPADRPAAARPRTRAPASSSGSPASPARARSSFCRTTRTSAWRPSRRRASATTAGSSSSRPATPPRAWRPCSPTSRTLDAAANVGPMTAAGRGLATIQVTEAVRDARIGGRKVRRARRSCSTRTTGSSQPTATATKAVLKAAETLPAGDRARHALLRRRRDPRRGRGRWPAGSGSISHVEKPLVIRGGQPHYRYLISAE